MRRALFGVLVGGVCFGTLGLLGCKKGQGEEPVAAAPATPDDEGQVLAVATRRGLLAYDPMAALRAASGVAVAHRGLAVRPLTGALVALEEDLRLPLEGGELVLVRAWRHTPGLAEVGAWDEHFGLGPGSTRCAEGARCDAGGRVTSFGVGEAEVAVTWAEGHPVSMSVGGQAVVRVRYDGARLVELVGTRPGDPRPAEVWPHRRSYGRDGEGRLSSVRGATTREYTYDGWGQLVAITSAAGRTTVSYDGEGRVVALDSAGLATRLRFTSADKLAAGVRAEVGVSQSGLDERRFVWKGHEVVSTFGGRETRWRFDDDGRVVSLEAGATTHFGWSGGRLIAVEPSGGPAQRLERDGAGRLVAVQEGDHRVTFAYDAAGRLAALGDSERGAAPVLTWQRDASGRVVERVDAGHRQTWSRDALGRVVAVSGEGGARTSTTWDASNGALATVEDERGLSLRLGYDDAGRLVSKTYPDGTRETFQWEGDEVVGSADRLGRTTRFTYDDGRIVRAESTTAGAGGVVTTRWDGLGRPLSEETPAGVRGWAWDPLGQLVGLEGPEGQTRMSFDAWGRRVETRVDGAVVERLGWAPVDQGGRLLTREAGGVVETMSYDGRGRVSRVEVRGGPKGKDLRYTYRGDAVEVSDVIDGTRWRWERHDGIDGDSAARLVSAIGPGGAPEAYRYGARGELLEKSSALGDGFVMAYDAWGLPTRIVSARGGELRLRWDVAGRWVGSDAAGVATDFERDALGRVVAVREGGGRWLAEYEGASTRIAALIDPAGRRTRIAYQGGRVAQVSDALGSRAWTYENGRVVAVTRRDGKSDRFEVDREGRFSAWKVEVGAPRDPGGAIEGATDGAVVRAVTRDDAGRIVRDEGLAHRVRIERAEGTRTEIDELRGVTVRRVLEGAVGAGGVPSERALALTVGGGDASAGGSRVDYVRRSDGLVERVSGPGGFGVEVQRDALGRWVGYRYAGGAVLKASFDAARRMTGLEVVGAGDRGVVFRAAWSYDDAGRLVMASVDGENGTFEYDDSGRLVGAKAGLGREGEARFEHTPSGELVRLGPVTVALDAAGRPVDGPLGPRRYGADGVLVERGGDRLESDLAGRIARVIRGDGTRIEYRYDGDGRLLSRTEGAQTRSFVWEGGLLVASYEGERWRDQATRDATFYVHDPDGLRLGLSRGGATRYLVRGPDGATLAIIDGAGAVVTRYRHGPWGEVTASGATDLDPFHYRGQFTDPTTGLIHFPMRWYDPSVGAFVAPDPEAGDLMRPRSLARYAYLEGDPLNRVDPWGAAGHEWQLGSSCLSEVCDLFQQGKILATHAYGKALDGFEYAGAIEKKGWVYDLWNKKIPGSDKVITIIRDLNEKAEGPFGKPNFSGNIVINPATPQHLGGGASGANSGGLTQTIRDGLTQVKQGLELHRKEVTGTVAGLGGLSGTLGAELTTLAALPGGVTIIGAGVAVAGAGGYGTGVLINMIPGVPEAAQAAISGAMGYQQDQALADLQAQAAAEGKAAKDARAKVIASNLDKDKGVPGEPKAGVAGGPVGLEPPPPGEAGGPGADPSVATKPPEKPDPERPEPERPELEDTDGDTAPPPFDILSYVGAKKIVMNFTETIDGSGGGIKNVITCQVTMSFWNVGALAPGYGGVSASSTCTASINGSVSKSSVGGTFSGGPEGVFTFSSPDGEIQAQMSGGATVTFPEIGARSVPPGAFDDWPKTLPPH